MKSRDVVGRTVTRISQERVTTDYGVVMNLRYIEFDNGARLIFHVNPSEDDAYVSGQVLTVKRQAQIRARCAPKVVTAMEKLTREQAQALKDYRQWCLSMGKDWKTRLSLDWQRAGSTWHGPYALLHQIRNRLGPSWLAKVTDAEVDAFEVQG